MIGSKRFHGGFFSVELLVVLFIAAAFTISGYQLYSSVVASSAYGKSDIAASNLANDYMERYRYRASTPCVEKTIIDSMAVQSDTLRGPVVTVKISCPINGVSSFLKNGVSSKVESTVTYDGGRTSSTSKIVNNKVTIKQVSSFYDFVVALGTDGHVYTWGSNSYGQLGINTAGAGNNALKPVSVISTTGPMAGKFITKVSAGGNHTLALSSDGEVYAWGYGVTGQLGDGTVISKSTPVEVLRENGVLAGRTIVDIATSFNSSAAIDSTGRVYTWGRGADGELGNGTTTQSTKAVAISGITNSSLVGKTIKSLVAGYYHFLALDSAGAVHAWGRNTNGQLGNDALVNASTPVVVTRTGASSLTGKVVKQVAAGGYTSYALADDSTGTVHVWGLGNSGQIGNNTVTTSNPLPSATTIAGTSLAGKVVSSISAGGTSSYAIDSQGQLHAWGGNNNGELGVGTIGTNTAGRRARLVVTESTPIQGRNITQIYGGRASAVALDNEGSIYGWGLGASGQIGNGTTATSSLAQNVSNGANISKITSGFYHTLALMNDNTLYAWGRGNYYQLGNNSTATRNFPITVTGAAMAGKHIINISSGAYHNFAWASDGTIFAWGRNTSGQIGDGTTTEVRTPKEVTPIPAGKTVAKIVSSELNSMALSTDGKVYAWGSNTYGQVGDGTVVTPVLSPYAVEGGSLVGKTIKDIALGRYNSYAVDSTGAVHAWGRGSNNANGNGSTANQMLPVDISTGQGMAGKDIIEIVAGAYFAIARAATGEVYVWGLNTNGQLGDGTIATKARPTLQPAGVKYEKMSAGDNFMAALGQDGYLYTWGANQHYQQANGTTANVIVPTAQAPFTARAIDMISTGAWTVLAVDYGKNIYGWGYNNYGDLGIANTLTPQQTPRSLTRIQYDNVW